MKNFVHDVNLFIDRQAGRQPFRQMEKHAVKATFSQISIFMW